jgi:hypothetical protein
MIELDYFAIRPAELRIIGENRSSDAWRTSATAQSIWPEQADRDSS